MFLALFWLKLLKVSFGKTPRIVFLTNCGYNIQDKGHTALYTQDAVPSVCIADT